MNPLLPIDTERLTLRYFEKSDLDVVLTYYAVPDVQRYLEWRARDERECKAALEGLCSQHRLNRPGDMLTLAVERQSERKLIGQVSLRWTDATAAQAEVRFVIGPQYRRQGYASEAVKACFDLGFDHYSFHRIFARCGATNQAPARLLEGLGMRLEAHYREHALFQGEWDEELHFAILDREWRAALRRPPPPLHHHPQQQGPDHESS
jgi:RimJ/RimL family protein N-acetyltransferase